LAPYPTSIRQSYGKVGTMLPVRLRRLGSHIPLPRYQTPGAAGFDLAAAETITIPPGEVRLIPTGLVIEVPNGYFLGIFARSSTPLRRGLMVANGVGVVDSDYCGATDEVKIQVLNFSREPVQVNAGDRIAQGLLLPVTRAEFHEADRDFREASRGGFGATGER
jgi:dUTP pyrophosphatase